MNPLKRLVEKWREEAGFRTPSNSSRDAALKRCADELESELVKCGQPESPVKRQIVITLEGGIIQDIANIAEDTEVVVLNFDTEDIPQDRLSKSPWSESEGKVMLSKWETGSVLPFKEVSNG